MQQSIYDPGFKAFGGGSDATILHPFVFAVVLVICILVFLLPRKQVLIPLVFGFLLIPYGQNFYIAGVHLFMAKVLIVAGLLRVVFSGPRTTNSEILAGGFGIVDKLFLMWAFYRATAVIFLFDDIGAVPGQVGFLWDAIGAYFLFRLLVRDDEDVQRITESLAVIAIIVAIGMIYEQFTLHNMFAWLGGVNPSPAVRNGRIRSQSVFGQPILAGSFGATVFPLYIWMWKRGRAKILASMGMIAALIITYTASSSTSIMALLGGIFALFLWPIRSKMKLIVGACVAGIVLLAFGMKSPVWFLLGHIDVVGGSSGWERANLIDNFIRHFGEWWLVGTHNNVNWGWDMWDLANQFVAEGVTGGFVTFLCFVGMIWVCFRKIGQARKMVEGDTSREWLLWILGALLFDQVLAFFGIDYFDQMRFMWYLVLAIILSATAGVLTQSASDTVHSEVVTGGIPLIRTSIGVERPDLAARNMASRSRF